MKSVSFLFCIHNHQPVGNFAHVFHEGFTRCYDPFLAILEKHPGIKTTLHFSGPLLEWLEAEQPEFLQRIRNLVKRGQVELLGGGFYEPIFSILRERDARGQIQMMTDFLQEKCAVSPKGIWLAERVWEPALPRLIAQSGLSYTLLDSTHFLYAGLSPEQIHGYYVTEKDGFPLSLFPIDMTLRYTIPFQQPEKTIEYLLYRASDGEGVAVTYGDDGEKFGMWPGTYSCVYENGWLESFFTLLEKNQKNIRMETFSEYLHSHRPQGRIYLPTLSYEEMMEWALPADAIVRYEEMNDTLRNLQLKDKYTAFIRGGYWNNFLVKYPESNLMHKKMLLVSEQLEQWENTAKKRTRNGTAAARRELYRGQCNCAYWHGLFGGIYLNYLRHAIYEHLITAEKIIDSSAHSKGPWVSYRVFDLDRDLSDEVLISGSSFNAYFAPHYGGSLFELDFKPRSFNLSNIMSRKMEAYHRKLKLPESPGSTPHEGEQPLSIHHISKIKTKGVQDNLFYDWFRRNSFLDHFLGEMTTLENFSRCQYTERGDFINQPYQVEQIKKLGSRPAVSMILSRNGFVWEQDGQVPIMVRKHFVCNDESREIEASYSIKNAGNRPVALWFGVEFNFTLLAGNDPLRYYLFPAQGERWALNSSGPVMQVEQFEMKDEWTGLGLKLHLSPAAAVWRFPLETVSQSEDGLEKTYQGSSLLTHWKITLNQNQEKNFSITLRLYEFPGKAPGSNEDADVH